MRESGRSAKEKPSRKGWASMCDISLIVLSGRLRQAPVVGFQAGKIVPGLGSCCLQRRHILRRLLSIQVVLKQLGKILSVARHSMVTKDLLQVVGFFQEELLERNPPAAPAQRTRNVRIHERSKFYVR